VYSRWTPPYPRRFGEHRRRITGAPGAAGDPTGYTWNVDSTQHVVYRGGDGHIHELRFNL
jgi:hypothetical protein